MYISVTSGGFDPAGIKPATLTPSRAAFQSITARNHVTLHIQRHLFLHESSNRLSDVSQLQRL